MKKNIILLFVCFIFLQACSDPKYDFSSVESFEASLYAQADKEGLSKAKVDEAMESFIAKQEKEFSALYKELSVNLNELMAKELDLKYDLDNAKSKEETDKIKGDLETLVKKRDETLAKYSKLFDAEMLALFDKKFANRELRDILGL